jgi:dsRNA-specific ribonuclease
MSHQSKYKQFPDWKYGYTLGPPSASNAGNYTIFNTASDKQEDDSNKTDGINDEQGNKDKEKQNEAVNETSKVVNPESHTSSSSSLKIEQSAETTILPLKDEETKERSLEDILRGRNPIMYCNDNSKVLKLDLDFEQTSESGPPHDKTFLWCCTLGDTKTNGTSGTKKGAKTIAAEEMSKIIDKLLSNAKTERKRSWFDSEYTRTLNNAYGHIITPQMFGQDNSDALKQDNKRQKLTETSENQIKCSNGAVNAGFRAPEKTTIKIDPINHINPISKLYEHCKKIKVPEPIFDMLLENVLEQTRSSQGVMYKKSEYTMQCEVFGKQYQGKSFTKKEAKKIAAAAAWDDINGKSAQNSISPKPGLTVGEMIAEAKIQHPLKSD